MVGAAILAEAWISAGLAATPVRIAIHLPRLVHLWFRGGFALGAVCIVCGSVVDLIWSRIPGFNPERRRFFGVIKAAAFAAPVVTVAAGYSQREALRLVEINIPMPGLPRDLDGLRIVQVSDLHLSPLVSEAFVARAIDMANETRAHLAVMTGDLISSFGDPLDNCIRQVSRLKADAGVYGCLGNHEAYVSAEGYTARQAGRYGVRFLRKEAALLRFGSAQLNLAGVDYQRRADPYLVGAEKLIVPGVTNILLSHNPDVFPVAAKQGYDLTIAGHTHGGQINIEILHHGLNVARFYTPYVYGLYERGRATAFVTRGVGTIGIPSRLGAPPEVALLRLCAI